MSKLNVLRDLIKKKPYLIWSVTDRAQLSLQSIVEAVLNYGSWKDFKYIQHHLGNKSLSDVFHELNNQQRCNLHPLARNYFSLYFDKNA